MNRALVAVIAFNEEENIASALFSLRDIEYDVIVIDDGSLDKTGQIARDLGYDVIRHSTNTHNAMNAVSTYLSYAYRQGYDVVCQFDGDGQHMAEELPKILEPVLNGEADYVIGSRFIDNTGFQSYLFRRLGIRLFSWLDSKIIGQQVTDITSGFRAYSPKIMAYFNQQYKYELYDTSQLLLLSYFAGARIKEVAVRMEARASGASEFSFIRSVMFPFKGIVCLIGEIIQRRN